MELREALRQSLEHAREQEAHSRTAGGSVASGAIATSAATVFTAESVTSAAAAAAASVLTSSTSAEALPAATAIEPPTGPRSAVSGVSDSERMLLNETERRRVVRLGFDVDDVEREARHFRSQALADLEQPSTHLKPASAAEEDAGRPGRTIDSTHPLIVQRRYAGIAMDIRYLLGHSP